MTGIHIGMMGVRKVERKRTLLRTYSRLRSIVTTPTDSSAYGRTTGCVGRSERHDWGSVGRGYAVQGQRLFRSLCRE